MPTELDATGENSLAGRINQTNLFFKNDPSVDSNSSQTSTCVAKQTIDSTLFEKDGIGTYRFVITGLHFADCYGPDDFGGGEDYSVVVQSAIQNIILDKVRAVDQMGVEVDLKGLTLTETKTFFFYQYIYRNHTTMSLEMTGILFGNPVSANTEIENKTYNSNGIEPCMFEKTGEVIGCQYRELEAANSKIFFNGNNLPDENTVDFSLLSFNPGLNVLGSDTFYQTGSIDFTITTGMGR
ncbi:MAG: hypothetical protein OEY59_10535, partial [Deltaproteobacteria bacterium]|nr:hypothetical protein [Deltaproteobacteria bacterium]